MPTINGERLLGDLRRIADFGRYQTGVHRPHLSPQDVESRHWLAARMKEAGLEPVIDGIGTVIGKSPKTGPRILIGSHSDTQPRGGWLDGFHRRHETLTCNLDKVVIDDIIGRRKP